MVSPAIARLFLATLVSGWMGLGGPPAAAVSRTLRTYQIPPAAHVRVVAAVGEIQVIGSSRSDVSVQIERRAPDAALLARLEERVDLDADGLTVSVLQAAGGHDPGLTSSVTLEVPASQPLARVEIFEGPLRLQGLTGGVRAVVTRGDIDARNVKGPLRLETVIGNLRVGHAPGPLTGALRLRTFNGDIDLAFPSTPVNARLLALTLNGTISSDLPLTSRTTVGPRFSEATFGTGATVINIDVVNGRIRIGRRS